MPRATAGCKQAATCNLMGHYDVFVILEAPDVRLDTRTAEFAKMTFERLLPPLVDTHTSR